MPLHVLLFSPLFQNQLCSIFECFVGFLICIWGWRSKSRYWRRAVEVGNNWALISVVRCFQCFRCTFLAVSSDAFTLSISSFLLILTLWATCAEFWSFSCIQLCVFLVPNMLLTDCLTGLHINSYDNGQCKSEIWPWFLYIWKPSCFRSNNLLDKGELPRILGKSVSE